MQSIESPVSPVCEVGIYFEEMFPFPSIPLLRVPYLVGDTNFVLVPSDSLKLQDSLVDAPSRIESTGHLVYLRELRLAIAPDGHGDFCAVIESRPVVEVTFSAPPVAGVHTVHGGFEPDVGDRGRPTIKDKAGQSWRLRYSNDSFWDSTKWVERDPETTGWQFDCDPVGAPGAVNAEPWYLSYTPATPDYLKHWLTRSWSLGDAQADCPWSRDIFGWGELGARYDRDLPPFYDLNFPRLSHATGVECCLHNGLIEEALQAAVTRLKHETASLQRDWHSARDANAQKLLNRWHTPRTEKD